MNNYFTIGEFAKLRNININSLRYYEKLGLLKPAYIDEKTNYRYYSPEQVAVLNKIILCINLGIPLKEMVEYMDKEGNLESQKLLERGKVVVQQRMEEMQNNFNFIESSLKNIEDSKKFENRKGIYHRDFEERKVIVSNYCNLEITNIRNEEITNVKNMLSKVSQIYKIAQENDLFPILPAGMIVELEKTKEIKGRFFLEIMNYKKEHPNIVTLPKGTYSCLQVEWDKSMNFMKIINDNWGEGEKKTIIVGNIMLERYSFKNKSSELQKLECEL